MNLQPNLENELIRIRPMTDSDLEPLYQVAKDPLIWQQHHVKRHQRNIFEKFFEESIHSGGALIILDKSTGEIMGSSRYNPIEGFPDGMEIGWTFLDRKYWGGRFNREIKNLMLDHAFHSVNHVILNINKFNLRSQKAAEKIGGKKLSKSEWTAIPRKNEDTFIYLFSKNQ